MTATTDAMSVAFSRMVTEDPTLRELFAPYQNRDGEASQQLWRCEDDWIVGYTTERIKGGPFDGKFAAMAYKPIGPGARTGKAKDHTRVYFQGFAKRKTARARAEALYEKHRAKK